MNDKQRRPRLTRVCEFYEDLAERSLERWARASRDIQRREYTAEKLISDAAAMWMDVTSAWIFSLTLAQGVESGGSTRRGPAGKR